MATYVVLGQFTDQGIRSVKETTRRGEAFRAMAQKAGITVTGVYWTLGEYDVVTVIEAPNDESTTALLLSAGALGNMRTQCLRAFSADEMTRILARMT
jgi:uncharacterized protein with GYD domain